MYRFGIINDDNELLSVLSFEMVLAYLESPGFFDSIVKTQSPELIHRAAVSFTQLGVNLSEYYKKEVESK